MLLLAVPISVIASFKKMKKLAPDRSLIVAALKESSLLVSSLYEVIWIFSYKAYNSTKGVNIFFTFYFFLLASSRYLFSAWANIKS